MLYQYLAVLKIRGDVRQFRTIDHFSFLSRAAEPVKILKPLKDLTVKEGETAVFVCELSKPDYKTTWLHTDITIPLDDDHYKQEVDGTTHRLVIPSATYDMNADFTIVAGDNKSSAKLTVIGESFGFIFSKFSDAF